MRVCSGHIQVKGFIIIHISPSSSFFLLLLTSDISRCCKRSVTFPATPSNSPGVNVTIPRNTNLRSARADVRKAERTVVRGFPLNSFCVTSAAQTRPLRWKKKCNGADRARHRKRSSKFK